MIEDGEWMERWEVKEEEEEEEEIMKEIELDRVCVLCTKSLCFV